MAAKHTTALMQKKAINHQMKIQPITNIKTRVLWGINGKQECKACLSLIASAMTIVKLLNGINKSDNLPVTIMLWGIFPTIVRWIQSPECCQQDQWQSNENYINPDTNMKTKDVEGEITCHTTTHQ